MSFKVLHNIAVPASHSSSLTSFFLAHHDVSSTLASLSSSNIPKYTQNPLLLVCPLHQSIAWLPNRCRDHHPGPITEVSLILYNLCPTILFYFSISFIMVWKKYLSLFVNEFIVCLSPLEYKPLEGINLMPYCLCFNCLEQCLANRRN